MEYTIRKANREEAKTIADLMFFAMKDIVFDFIGEQNEEKSKQFLSELIAQENNQYSYQNSWILEFENQIAGSFTIYNGEQLDELRQPVLDLLKDKYNRVIHPQDETEAGEYYIDTIAIFPEFRGKGFGNSILDYIIEEFANKKGLTLGLLVDFTNPKAKKLYESKGFKVVGEKQLMRENHEHMQYKKGA